MKSTFEMNYKLLNYFFIINTNYVTPDATNTQLIRQFMDLFIEQHFFPRVQEAQTFQFQMNGNNQPKTVIRKTLGLISLDNRWIINFLPEQIEIAYNSDLESDDIGVCDFLNKVKEYLRLINNVTKLNNIYRLGFVVNYFSEGLNIEYNQAHFPSESLSDDLVEVQHNSVKRKSIDGIDFNIVKTLGYYSEAEINYINGTKKFKGNVKKIDVNTVVSENNKFSLDIIDLLSNEIFSDTL
ncbi:hypothetical protein [Acinetobacter tibetensis]|uniref:Uncharacterized protein n=1 Tax=Acinetobacter tibetensis TaxID=2943497 RepID=A0AAE9LT80_9GAMM|nr:hypothetical protein [Acinetobacter tibetensis]USE84362.1 hypothetical protein M5E07_06060 [Acinetobacter tibetensis]